MSKTTKDIELFPWCQRIQSMKKLIFYIKALNALTNMQLDEYLFISKFFF